MTDKCAESILAQFTVKVPQWFSVDLILPDNMGYEFVRHQTGTLGHFVKTAVLSYPERVLFISVFSADRERNKNGLG